MFFFTIFFLFRGIFEYLVHTKNLNSIPIRIHVNGTRGKSSVVRLIAAGLREGGIETFAKTIGSLPKMIIDDNIEFPIHRQVRANILEQLRVIAFASSNRAEALVLECMALQPFLQFLSEKKIVRATSGVITNAREDHLDVMGPTEKDVALALLGTMPNKSRLFTCEKDYPEEFKNASTDCRSELIVVSENEIKRVTEEEQGGFLYYEHKENFALAVKVLKKLAP